MQHEALMKNSSSSSSSGHPHGHQSAFLHQNPSLLDKRYEGAGSAPKAWDYHQQNRPSNMQVSLSMLTTPRNLLNEMDPPQAPPMLEERKVAPKREKNPALKPFPTHLTPAQRAIIVAIPKRRSKIFHHLQCRRKAAHPSNYNLTTVGEASLQGCRPVSHRAGCCYNELLQLFQ